MKKMMFISFHTYKIRDYSTNSQLSDVNIEEKCPMCMEYLEYQHFCFMKRKYRKNRHVQSERNRDCAK